MRTRTLLTVAMIATTNLCAQETDKKAPEGMPNPKTEHHAALAQWAGTWKLTGKMDAMPGVPGMEEATESEGLESASLICDGLWLKWESVVNSNDKRSTALWLVGYDPFEEQYVSYVVSSDDHCRGLNRLTGEYDEEAKTWTWVGESPEGTFKSVCKFTAPDRLKETLYMIDQDGEETQFMVMDRVRSKDAKPVSIVNASLKASDTEDEMQIATLLRDVGAWDAVVESESSGETTTEKATERVHAICDGRWTWSEFHGQYMGKPFVGHALVGWDANQEQYASLWIDSMSATGCLTAGTFDEEAQTYEFSGSCAGPDGMPMKVDQVISCEGKDSRVLRMEFDHPEMKSTMKITYTRSAKK